MEEVRIFLVNLTAAVLGFLAPIQDFMTAAMVLFGMNFVCGLVADLVSGNDWSWKKAFVFFTHCFIFFGLAAFIFICGHYMHNDAGAIQCVSIGCYGALYLYGCNIARNLRSLCAEGSIMHVFLDYVLFVLQLKFVTKLPYWREYKDKSMTGAGNGWSNRGSAGGDTPRTGTSDIHGGRR